LPNQGGPVEDTPFGRYRLVELLGHGGVGEVWRALDTRTDRMVAIKVLLPHFAKDSTFEERFRREAHAAARLNNPHVRADATDGVSARAQANRVRLRSAMAVGGLSPYDGEWWHFDGPDADVHRPIINVPVS
jgi:serine/threonine protein kinase